MVTLENMFDFIKEEVKPDLMFWTGDNSAHDVWENTENEVINYTQAITDAIKKQLPGLEVYPSIGNHDTWPVNVEDFSNGPGQSKPLKAYEKMWRDFIGDEAAKAVGDWGYYITPLVVKGQRIEGVKVIGLNMQACNNMNWYLLQQLDDPGHELEWLENQLKELEANGEVAFIGAHIPPSSCVHSFAARFRAIMDRYQHIIPFSFYGHAHSSGLHITKSYDTEEAIGVNMVSGSVTTYHGKNPAFTVFELDSEFMVPVKISTYIFNITDANHYDRPQWTVMHDFAQDYKMKDLRPEEFKNLADSIRYNEETALYYLWNNERRAPNTWQYTCDEHCRQRIYCDVSTTETFQEKDCMGHPHLSFNMNGLFEILVDPYLHMEE